MIEEELIARISERTGIKEKAVTRIIERMKKTMKKNLIAGEGIYLRGFGTFLIVERKAKIGQNIYENIPVVIPAHKLPVFKPSKKFKAMIK